MDSESFSDAKQRAAKGAATPSLEVDNMAFKYLSGLPSRGYFSAPVLSSDLGGIRAYVCDHETAPPEGQVINTNTTNILIRALQNNKQKGDLDVKSSTGKRSVRTSKGRPAPKKTKTISISTSNRQGNSSNRFSEQMLQIMTVERLRALLKDRGLSPKGKKDELIARLKDEA